MATAVLTAFAGVVTATAGAAPAHAADAGDEVSALAARAAGRPWHDAVTEPARGINRFSTLPRGGGGGSRDGGAGGAPAQTAAHQTSSNWAGYAATGAVYTSVTASWVQPSVTCTTRGVIAFWVGLDGWGSDSVEQAGTGVDCSGGSPQQFAWWETYPANSIQRFADTISAGDHVTSTVTSEAGSVYDLVLTDATKGWTERKSVVASGAHNASAEVVAEAVTSGGAITPLPDFHAVDFTASQIDGKAPQADGAEAIDLADDYGELLAQTSALDAAGDFEVDYTGALTTASQQSSRPLQIQPAREPSYGVGHFPRGASAVL